MLETLALEEFKLLEALLETLGTPVELLGTFTLETLLFKAGGWTLEMLTLGALEFKARS